MVILIISQIGRNIKSDKNITQAELNDNITFIKAYLDGTEINIQTQMVYLFFVPLRRRNAKGERSLKSRKYNKGGNTMRLRKSGRAKPHYYSNRLKQKVNEKNKFQKGYRKG